MLDIILCILYYYIYRLCFIISSKYFKYYLKKDRSKLLNDRLGRQIDTKSIWSFLTTDKILCQQYN